MSSGEQRSEEVHSRKTRAPAGFIAEMRTVAMKLHTPKQAPGEGEKPERNAEERPVAQVNPMTVIQKFRPILYVWMKAYARVSAYITILHPSFPRQASFTGDLVS